MKTRIGLLTLVFLCSFIRLNSAFAQGTAFTYQGQLLTTNGPAHGLYDLTFALYNAGSGGSQFGSTVQTNGVLVTNGLFVVTVDFGGGLFNGTPYWLQIGVRTNGAALFTALTGRQELTPAPYAIYAEDANTTTTLGGLPAADFWQLTGNTVSSGQFLGSLNSQPVVFKVNDLPSLTLELNGSLAMGTGIASGIDSVALGFGSTTSGGSYEVAIGNTAQATGNGSVAIGWLPVSSGPGSVALGESVNSSGNDSFAGGYGSHASGQYSVAMGHNSLASGISAWALGNLAQATNNGSFVWADDSTNSVFGDTSPNQFLIRSAGGVGINTTAPNGQLDVEGNFANGIYANTPISGGNGIVGVAETGTDAYGVWGQSSSGYGVVGTSFGTGTGVWGEGGSGVGVFGTSSSSNAIYGMYQGVSGTTAAVEGDTASTTSSANAVYGRVTSTSPGANSAGVRGENDGTDGLGIGVYGSQAGGGWGVYGYAPSGLGVYGDTSSGTGVEAESVTGTGVYAYSSSGVAVDAYSSTGSALTIENGAIHVAGAGVGTATASFIFVTASTNIVSSNGARISNPLCNGDPNAILYAIHNLGASGDKYHNHPIGVYYDGVGWQIFNEDEAAMPTNIAFNVLIIKN